MIFPQVQVVIQNLAIRFFLSSEVLRGQEPQVRGPREQQGLRLHRDREQRGERAHAQGIVGTCKLDQIMT